MVCTACGHRWESVRQEWGWGMRVSAVTQVSIFAWYHTCARPFSQKRPMVERTHGLAPLPRSQRSDSARDPCPGVPLRDPRRHHSVLRVLSGPELPRG